VAASKSSPSRGPARPTARRREESARGPGRPPGASGDRTRELILDAAVRTFAEKGLAGSSVRDIARQARLRVSSLYHYFPSKEALYQEVQARWTGEIRDLVLGILSKGLDLREATREMIGQLFDHFLEHRDHARLGCRLNLEGFSMYDPAVNSRWLGLAEGFLKPAEINRTVKEIDPVLFMMSIDALAHWHVVNDGLYRSLMGKGLEDPDVARRTRDHVIQMALRALGLE
jgi:AcrR family transcriptional regulator